ncbi:hypothetical protein FKG94_27065 [Exilibacterium tricleocarpae]|uniref:DUF3592 domain-containing protein n=1 Tax=Exilibacterium tricleocarpae TaxID=2591008 RepID=A0A545SNQ7_9GAMM|nr:hypothetical protein [Exilibacterium tricleocarpae]TQV66496.1 hypothetical protein FKG94_27065 [Exilibacterium tricleocarpae]
MKYFHWFSRAWFSRTRFSRARFSKTWFSGLALLIVAGGALAQNGDDFRTQPARHGAGDTYVYAEVVNVEPIYALASPPPAAEGIWLAGTCGTIGTRCRPERHTDSAVPLEYRVTYSFRGREFQTRLDHDPGQWIRITYSPTRYWRM